jgi:hypothetical protein
MSILPSKEVSLARAVISDPKTTHGPRAAVRHYPQTGGSVEIFYADRALTRSFGTGGAGWFLWACQGRVHARASEPPIHSQLFRNVVGAASEDFTGGRFKNQERAVIPAGCLPRASPKNSGKLDLNGRQSNML